MRLIEKTTVKEDYRGNGNAKMTDCTRYDDYAALEGTWKSLLSKGAPSTVFTSWEFQSLWWEVFGPDYEPHFLVYSDESGPFGIAPLMRRVTEPRQADESFEKGDFLLVGGVEVCDYLDFVALPGRTADVVEATFGYLSDYRGSRLDLRDIAATSGTTAIVEQSATRRGLEPQREVEDVCPRLDLPSDWEAYLASLGKKDRHELRRKERRLLGGGDVRWHHVSGESPADMDDFIRLHRLSDPGKDAFMREEMLRFFHALAARFAPTGLFRIYFMEVDGQRVSATTCFLQEQELWLYNSGYDPAYSPLSVGLLLKAYCLKDAITMGLRGFDFLRGREPYKYDLGAIDAPVYRLTVKL